MRGLVLLVAIAACKPGGGSKPKELCAGAAAMYEKCESRGDLDAQQWELVIDRWRGLCRAVMTGETKQLLPDGLALFSEMTDGTKQQLRAQAECAAAATDCPQYAACSK
jgi:hypothetical protein